MANEKNLRPSEYKFTHEDSVKGGKKSVEARRKRKAMREAFEELLEREYTDSNGKKVDGTTLLCMRQFRNAMDGNLRAFTEIRDTIGEMPVQRMEIDTIDPQARAEMDELLGLDD